MADYTSHVLQVWQLEVSETKKESTAELGTQATNDPTIKIIFDWIRFELLVIEKEGQQSKTVK